MQWTKAAGTRQGSLVVARMDGLVCCTLHYAGGYCIELVVFLSALYMASASLGAKFVPFKQGHYAMIFVG